MTRLKFTLDATACILFILILSTATCEENVEYREKEVNRRGKLFNILQIVRFPNDPCSGSGNMNGTCYTESECEDRGGTKNGECASGFGICCTFTIGCGSSSNENCTYFEATGANAGNCASEICPCNSNICQLRLDFVTFDIAGPATTSVSSFTQINGEQIAGTGIPASINTQCTTDTFAVTSPNGVAPPTICGVNTGEHMYVDSSAACNKLNFNFGSASTSAGRSFKIKVTQYSCDYENLAPSGCTQYFFGSSTGLFQTYNFNSGNGQHLANQEQNICFRRERGNCKICYSAMATTDFMLSGKTSEKANANPINCCAYGADGMGTVGYDCLIIPGALKNSANFVPANSRVCGRKFVSGGRTRCSRQTPFMVQFMSDSFENAGAAISEAANADVGFRLAYWMDNVSC